MNSMEDTEREPEYRKNKKQRGKSAAAKSKPVGTINEFYTNEISEMITRTSQNFNRSINRRDLFTPGTLTHTGTESMFGPTSNRSKHQQKNIPTLRMKRQRP